MVLTEANDLVHPASILLVSQEFWIQVKGLPLAYKTRHMGQFIGNQIGQHVLTYQSRRSDVYGSILRIRVAVDIEKPLRKSLRLVIEGFEVGVDLRYEKIPLTFFLYGTIRHLEEHCVLFPGKSDDDLSKPYGRWFQFDALGADYRKPKGTRFGLDGAQGRYMKAPVLGDEEMEEGSSKDRVPNLGRGAEEALSELGLSLDDGGTQEGMLARDSINGERLLPYLNNIVDSEDMLVDSMAIIPFQLQLSEQETCGVTLFGVDLNVAPPGDRGTYFILAIGDSGGGSCDVDMRDEGFLGFMTERMWG